MFQERFVVAFPRGHHFEALNAVPLEQLDGEDCLQRIHCEFRYHFDALGVPAKHKVNVRFSSEREEWVQALILAGLGSAVMPESTPMMPGLCTRVIIEPEVSRSISLVNVAGRMFSPAQRAFVEMAQRHDWNALSPALALPSLARRQIPQIVEPA